MAKKIHQGGKPAQTQAEQIALRVVVEPGEGTETFYANYAEVSHGAYEIGISFVHVPTKFSSAKLSEATAKGVLVCEPRLMVALPHAVARGLITALQTQIGLLDELTNAAANESQERTIE